MTAWTHRSYSGLPTNRYEGNDMKEIMKTQHIALGNTLCEIWYFKASQTDQEQRGLTLPWGTRHSSGSFDFSDCSSQSSWWVIEEVKDSATLLVRRPILLTQFLLADWLQWVNITAEIYMTIFFQKHSTNLKLYKLSTSTETNSSLICKSGKSV